MRSRCWAANRTLSQCAEQAAEGVRRATYFACAMVTYASSHRARRGWAPQRRKWTDETILCALVAREWRWRGCSVAEVALGLPYDPQFWRYHESAPGVWITDAHADRALRALEERIRHAEEAVAALAADEERDDAEEIEDPLGAPETTARLRGIAFARDAYASALTRRRSADHPECLRAEARLLEAHIALLEDVPNTQLARSPHADARHDLRVAALRRRWDAAERSQRATKAERALAFRLLVEAASAAG